MAIHRGPGEENAATSPDAFTKNRIRRSSAEAVQPLSTPDNARQAGPGPGIPEPRRVRHITALVFSIVAAVLSFAAVPALYLHSDVLDTHRYVALVAPLASDPAIQAEVSNQVTAQITDSVDIDGIVRDAMTELGRAAPRVATLIEGFAPAIAEETRSLIHTTVSNFVASPQFQDLWTQANRVAHEAIVNSARGESGGPVGIDESGTVTISTKEIVLRVKARLIEQGIAIAARIPETEGQIILFQSPALARTTAALGIVDRSAPVLAWLTVLSAAGGIAVAPRGSRLRATGRLGMSIGVAMGTLALALAVVLDFVLDTAPTSTVSPEAARNFSDALLAPMRTDMRFVAIVGLLIAAAAFLAGRSQPAALLRQWLVQASGRPRVEEPGSGRSQPWQHQLALFRQPLESTVTGAAVLVLVLWDPASAAAAIWTVVLTGILILLVELLFRLSARHTGGPAVGGVTEELPRAGPFHEHPSSEPPDRMRHTAARRPLHPFLQTASP